MKKLRDAGLFLFVKSGKWQESAEVVESRGDGVSGGMSLLGSSIEDNR
jgi:hypothetical protein